MLPITIQEIADSIGAKCAELSANLRSQSITEISTDSRNLPSGCLFLALEGENFDGHSYIDGALKAGAVCAVAHKRGDYPQDRVLIVENTEAALLAIAGLYRKKFPVRIVGVTGSVGKTTTKEMIAAVLSSHYKTLKTKGNLNNQIGLPKTLFELDESYETAVIEMGMSGFGEIEALTLCTRPDMAVITNIGVSHMEALKTRENILKAKLEIVKGLTEGSPLFLCDDNDLLSTVNDDRFEIIRYGVENPDNLYRATDITEYERETAFTVVCPQGSFRAVIPCVGRHNILNAVCAFAVGVRLEIPPGQCVKALESYEPSGMRQKIVPFCGFTVVEDCYNASPDSMRAALDTLGKFVCMGKRIAVLADMLELGENSEEMHREVGRFAVSAGVDQIYAYGDHAAEYVNGAGNREEDYSFESKDALIGALKQTIQKGDVVWFKGSRGMKLEEVIERLYKEMTE